MSPAGIFSKHVFLNVFFSKNVFKIEDCTARQTQVGGWAYDRKDHKDCSAYLDFTLCTIKIQLWTQ